MVQFGRTLNEVVQREWRCHAVSYMELKRALRNNPDCDNSSAHTDSSYNISGAQKTQFFSLYDDSIFRLNKFYQDKIIWAQTTFHELEIEVNECLSAVVAEPELPNVIDRTTNFSKDLGLVLEFLQLNATAFSKIMKKFDKRTGSNLRTAKLRELELNSHFLYDGGILKRVKIDTDDWVKQLYFYSAKQRPNAGVVQNVGASGIVVENPQGSDSTEKSGGTKGIKWKENLQTCNGSTQSIIETKESRRLKDMIDRVNEELYIQKVRSPFFEKCPQRSAPPTFVSAEIELNQVLGRGEFCELFEIVKFHVTESCHICFLHRGFENSTSSLKKSPAFAMPPMLPMIVNMPHISPDMVVENRAIESSLSIENKLPMVATHESKPHPCELLEESSKYLIDPLHTLTIAEHNTNNYTPKKSHDRIVSEFSFEYDANISDYDELEEDHEDEYDHETRGFMKDHCLRDGEARYAIKRLRNKLRDDNVIDAAIDLAREAQFLAGLSHSNIIKIRGTCGEPGHPKYSLILDRLYDTLETQIKIWKKEVKHHQGFMHFIGRDNLELKKHWITRLLSAYDVANAMKYVHSRGIIHRDLKPANIGFDIRGDIKIFDFGLAKELKPSHQVGQDQYRTSGIAGTRRYMAPEVAQVIPYGFSADVYSFGIIVWEMMTLKPAFHNYTRSRHFKEVVVEGKRPKIPWSWPFVERNLLERCWAPTPSERPTFQAVCELIKFGLPNEYLESTRSTDLMQRSNKSTGVQANVDGQDSLSDSLSRSVRSPYETHLSREAIEGQISDNLSC